MRNHHDVKRRYKMYKAGKAWLYAPLLFLSMGAGVGVMAHQAQAATTTEAPVAGNSARETTAQDVTARELQLRTPVVEATTSTETVTAITPRAAKPAAENQATIPGLVQEGDKVHYFQPGEDGKPGTEKATGWTTIPGRTSTSINDYNFGADGNLTPQLQEFQKEAEWLAQVTETREEAEPYFAKSLSTLNQAIERTETTLKDAHRTPVAMLDSWDGLQKSVHGILQAVLDQEASVKETEAFKNATPEAQNAYSQEVHDAGEIQFDNPNVTPDEVAKRVEKILTLRDQLSGKKLVVSKADLKKVVDEAKEVKGTHQYFNASAPAKQAYDQALAMGQAVLDQADADQPAVDKAAQELRQIQVKLTGQPTDVTKLQVQTAAALKVKQTTNYQGAGKDRRETLDAKIKAAVVLANQVGTDQNRNMVTQVTVDQLTGELETAQRELDGDKRQLKEMKKALKQAILEAQAKQAAKIAHANLPQDQRQAKLAAVKQRAEAAQKAIEAATTPDAVSAAKVAGVQAITEVDPQPIPPVEPQKPAPAPQIFKGDLRRAVDAVPTIKKTAKYFNASEDRQKTYDQLVANGQTVLNQSGVTQSTVNEAYQNLEQAQNQLDGKPTDAKKLQALLADATTRVKKTPQYLNASKAVRDAFDAKAFEGVVVNTKVTTDQNKEMITQVNVDQLVGELEAARAALDGERRPEVKVADLTRLQKVVTEAGRVQKLHIYFNGSTDLQKNYDTKIAAGAALLKQANPNQPLVDATVQEIVSAKAALDGRTTDPAGLKAAVAAAVQAQKTVNYTAATKDRQSTFDAKLKAAVVMGQKLVADQNPEKITQAMVDQLAGELETAQKELDGDKRQLQQMKKAFKQMILEAQAKKAAEIANSNLPADQMKDRLAVVQRQAEMAQQSIDAGTTSAEVIAAKNAGIKAIAAVTTTLPELPAPAPEKPAEPMKPEMPKPGPGVPVAPAPMSQPEAPAPAPEKPAEPMKPEMPMPGPGASVEPMPAPTPQPEAPAPMPAPEKPAEPMKPEMPKPGPGAPVEPVPAPMPQPEVPAPMPAPEKPAEPMEPEMPMPGPGVPVEPAPTPRPEAPAPMPEQPQGPATPETPAEPQTPGQSQSPAMPVAPITPEGQQPSRSVQVAGGDSEMVTASRVRRADLRMQRQQQTSARKLPQTGDGQDRQLGLLGLSAVGMLTMLGLGRVAPRQRR